jgi:ATP-dependent DNA ligase
VLRAKYMDSRRVELFGLVCEQDLEGIVAKHKRGAYMDGRDGSVRAGETSWFKIKNPTYSQGEGRQSCSQSERRLRVNLHP